MLKVPSKTALRASLLLTLVAPALAACGSGDDTIVTLPSDAGTDATTKADGGSDAATEAAQTEDGGAGEASTDGGGPIGLAKINHFVVFYMENHSFDNLYGELPGAEGLSAVDASSPNVIQLGGDGGPYGTLPFPPNATVFADAAVPNAPFPTQSFYAVDQDTIDLHHIFFTEQFQINDGGMNKFTYYSDALGFTMGHWHTMSFPVPTLATQFTVCDHFFHAAFGGSFLNHFWLIAARTPEWMNPIAADAGGPSIDDPAVVMANPGIGEGQLTADGFVVNTSFSVNQPHPLTQAATNLVPNQTFPTIGDRLTAAGQDWAWYAGGWNDAIVYTSSNGATVPPNWNAELYQYHHQPFVYFANFADGTPAKAAHLKDEMDFVAAASAGTLPAVSFVKPVGLYNEHPGYSDMLDAENHLLSLIQAVQNSPNWSDTAIIITYDEHGGQWDHVAPPSADRWGPGSRVPAIVISPFAKKGFVDKTPYDTTSILATIEARWNLTPLTSRDMAATPMTAAFDFGQ